MDPLQIIYTNLLTEAYKIGDHRDLERDQNGNATTNLEAEEGLHIIYVDEVILTSGIAVPAEVEFECEYIDSGFGCIPFKFIIPKNVSPEEVGGLTPGTDITNLISDREYVNVTNYIERLMGEALQGAKDSAEARHGEIAYERGLD